MKPKFNKPLVPYNLLLAGLFIAAFLQSCSSAQQQAPQQAAPALPVLQVGEMPATTFQEYTAALEGKTNVEIRPQVDGYLEEIYADEGAYVKAGQPLFRINAGNYREQANNAQASLAAAQANLEKAQLEVERLTPLVKNNIVSDVQLKTAQAAYDAAKASVAQARALKGNAEINVGYTLIKAPVSGYIGRIPYKKGSLVGRGETQPLTVISDISEVYAYFSMSEVDFLEFKNHAEGATVEQKLKQLPPVELVLADNSVYPVKGRVETVEGQFDKTAGSISFRATFPNADGSLRSGNTGRVRIPRQIASALIVPQEATFEIQDKVFVYAVADSNKVVSKPIAIAGKTANYYFVSGGVKPGEKIVLSGTGNLKDGAVIAPQMVSGDSLLKAKPL
jgi:membrane fusion protein (multidrug efflux system)